MKRCLMALMSVTALAGGLLAGCGDDDTEASSATAVEFVGTVDGSDAFIALAVDGDTATAYICDGAEEWGDYEGTVVDAKTANPRIKVKSSTSR